MGRWLPNEAGAAGLGPFAGLIGLVYGPVEVDHDDRYGTGAPL